MAYGARMSRQAFVGPMVVGMVLTASVAEAVQLEWTVGVSGAATARSGFPGDLARSEDGGVAVVTGDLSVVPAGEVALNFGATRVSLGYSPNLFFREPLAKGPVLVLHNGRVGVTTRWQGGSFTFSETGAYGVTDINPLRVQEGTPATTVSNVQTVNVVPYLSSTTTATIDQSLATRVRLGLSASYIMAGSLNSVDGGTPTADPVTTPLPFSYGPSGTVAVTFIPSQADSLAASVQAMQASFVNKRELVLIQAGLMWNRQFSSTFTTSLTVGAAMGHQRVCTAFEGQDYCEATNLPSNWDPQLQKPGWTSWEVLPLLAAAATGQIPIGLGSPIGLTASLRLAPYADRITAAVYARLEGRLQAEWSPVRTFVVRLGGGAGYALQIYAADSQGGQQLYMGDAGVGWTPVEWFTLQLTGRAVWVILPQQNPSRTFDWGATLTAAFRLRGSVSL